MARLIDADAIDKRYVPIAPLVDWATVHYEWVAFIDDINELPTIDAIPIEWILNNERMPKEGKGRKVIMDMLEDWRKEHEWCTDCKEYDQTQHCCHRFTKVIRQTQEELKQNAVPVKHGKWVFNPSDAFEAMFAKPKCSECGFESADGWNYCPNCGARMDENE